MRAALAMVLLVLSGCGDAGRATLFSLERNVSPVRLPDGYVDPELAPLVAAFRADADRLGRRLDEPDRLRVVFIGEPDAVALGEVGLCTSRSVERRLSGTTLVIRTVVLLRSLVEYPYALRRSVYHELGHCLLGLGHEDAPTPRSIMAATFVRNAVAEEPAWHALVEELFRSP